MRVITLTYSNIVTRRIDRGEIQFVTFEPCNFKYRGARGEGRGACITAYCNVNDIYKITSFNGF